MTEGEEVKRTVLAHDAVEESLRCCMDLLCEVQKDVVEDAVISVYLASIQMHLADIGRKMEVLPDMTVQQLIEELVSLIDTYPIHGNA